MRDLKSIASDLVLGYDAGTVGELAGYELALAIGWFDGICITDAMRYAMSFRDGAEQPDAWALAGYEQAWETCRLLATQYRNGPDYQPFYTVHG